jgi:hypothetical protein
MKKYDEKTIQYKHVMISHWREYKNNQRVENSHPDNYKQFYSFEVVDIDNQKRLTALTNYKVDLHRAIDLALTEENEGYVEFGLLKVNSNTLEKLQKLRMLDITNENEAWKEWEDYF